MTSLREEIKDFIWNNYSKDTTVLDQNVDEILKLFEKRIDEIRQSKELDYHGDETDWGINIFYDKVKELLK